MIDTRTTTVRRMFRALWRYGDALVTQTVLSVASIPHDPIGAQAELDDAREGLVDAKADAVELLRWVGLVRIRTDGSVRWPVRVDPWWIWKLYFKNPEWAPSHHTMIGGWFCVFRNRRAIKYEPDRLLPRRWGVRIIGLEIGDRG